ncbi:dopaminechrome tautomerase [Anabrus simplex]|uniref:dopaminechrome tautomerase n=1 Tax=Anabrus simplex TaxID=316456 RepID=UPI0035A29F8B
MPPLSWLWVLVMATTFVSAGLLKFKDPGADLLFMLNGANLEWPCISTKNIYVSSGRYIPKHVIATRLQIFKDEAIVLTPRYKPGVPFTLSKMSLKHKDCFATLSPFPCWSLQEEGNCQALQSAVDLFMDPNGILWVLDVGIVNTLVQPIRRCPPKVVGIDVKTGLVVKVIDLSSLVSHISRLQYLAVEYTPDGQVFIYISDAATRAIIVFNVNLGKGFRIVLPAPVLDGCTRLDVLYIALVLKSNGNTVLYFTYLSGTRIFSIKTASLQRGVAKGSIVEVGIKPAKIVVLGTDGGSSIFFRNKGEGDIFMWNTDTCFKPDNFVLVQKGGDCRLATQVVPGFKKLMWVLESNFHDYIQNTVGCVGASVALHPLVKTCD